VLPWRGYATELGNGMTDSDRFEEQMRIAREAMHRYRHALRALATGETIDEAREAVAREEAEAENRTADSSPEPLRGR